MLKTAALSAEGLAAILDQSVDCVKLIGLGGEVLWMNSNGLCAMEIDDFEQVRGRSWSDLWPEQSRQFVVDAIPAAAAGEIVRFDAECPTAKGSRRWWNVTVSGVTGIDGEGAGFLAISRDITSAEEGRQALLIAAAEFRHRLKNTYAMIGSLISGFAKGDPGLEQFAREMQSRLVTLSRAQALFSEEDVPCDIVALIPALVEPCATPGCSISLGDIAEIALPKGQADAVALVLGELSVNSAKHGAVANGGSINVGAALCDGAIEIVWTERSNATVSAHDREGGQGLKLIDRIVGARDGSLAVAWRNDGLDVTLRFMIA